MQSFSVMLEDFKTYFKEDIWRRGAILPSAKAAVIKIIKLLLLSWRGFSTDLCPLRASALTLYTLLSIVPVFAMLFGIAKGFGMEEVLRETLLNQFRNQEVVANKLFEFTQAMLAKTQGGVVAGVGVAVLFWTVMELIGEIEISFNYIWKVAQGRTLSRKTSDYLSLMLLAPTLLIISSSIAVYMQTNLSGLIKVLPLSDFGSALLIEALGFLPMLIIWLLFSVMFIFMPNTKVNYSSGIIAGIAAGTAYQLTQWAYIRLQIGVSNYNAIYGSFAALPLFIVWLHIGWLILLFGAELAFYHQNFERYAYEDEYSGSSFALKKIAALRIVHLLVQRFAAAEPPLGIGEIAQNLHLPTTAVQSIIMELVKTHIVAEVNDETKGTPAYQPARNIDLLRISTVIEALENYGKDLSAKHEEWKPFKDVTVQFNEAIKNSPANRLLKDI